MRVFLLIASLVSLFGGNASTANQPPNIVIIMADDMGYSDIGCYGSEIETPHLDQLAAEGLRYTQFYSTSRCCPTRACLLTGLYPHQAGVGGMMNDAGVEGYRGDLNRNCVTIAEVLGAAGYATFMSGKYHVTKQTKPKGPEDKYNWPLQRGFDRFYGTITGAGSFWDPSTLVRDNTMITPATDSEYQPDEPFYYTDAISDNACRFVRQHSGDSPLFMYVAYTCAHWPMHARPRDTAKYRGRYDAGYEPIRLARFERMKQLGVVAADAELSPAAADWKDVEDKAWEVACMETYAAMIDNMDQGVGRIIQTLRQTGRLENTVIVYLQDNGGCHEAGGRGMALNPRDDKPSLPVVPPDQQHYFGAWPKQTRDGWPVRTGRVMPGADDTFIGYGRAWANVSNTPFREYKHWVHEGGIATPLIVHWPQGFAARGESRHQPSHLIDLMASFVDLADASYPTEYREQSITPMEGCSLVPTFTNQPIERESLYWEHMGNRAIRSGKWKLVAKGAHRQDEVDWELYDIEADRSELHNLAETYPERVATLASQWRAYAERARVIPWPPKKN
ncbi:arylsulfatase [Pirellulales bacterium]|nr:arylsulfatase [Pirellulales bacterium]